MQVELSYPPPPPPPVIRSRQQQGSEVDCSLLFLGESIGRGGNGGNLPEFSRAASKEENFLIIEAAQSKKGARIDRRRVAGTPATLLLSILGRQVRSPHPT